MTRFIRRACFTITLFFSVFINSFILNAADLNMLALVSDRSAASMVAGAHHFLATQDLATQGSTTLDSTTGAMSKSSITIRSVSQLNQLTNEQIQQLINQHQALVIAGVFGESVERLLALTYQAQQTRLIVNADRRLMVLHQDSQGGRIADLPKKQLQT